MHSSNAIFSAEYLLQKIPYHKVEKAFNHNSTFSFNPLTQFGRLTSKEDIGASPIQFAAKYDSYEVAKLFLENGADVNEDMHVDDDTMTVLHFAAIFDSANVVKLLLNKCAR